MKDAAVTMVKLNQQTKDSVLVVPKPCATMSTEALITTSLPKNHLNYLLTFSGNSVTTESVAWSVQTAFSIVSDVSVYSVFAV